MWIRLLCWTDWGFFFASLISLFVVRCQFLLSEKVDCDTITSFSSSLFVVRVHLLKTLLLRSFPYVFHILHDGL